jgi:serine/threonine protein kinase/Tfp pilus assembly protein PilF
VNDSSPGPSLQDIFARALELETQTARAGFLADACGGDARLRSEVESLLRAFGEAGDFLESPASTPMITADRHGPTEGPGATIGPYRLREVLGEGGMGVVYVAEQSQPVRRRVALKVIKPGMDTRQVIARFEAERQALAMMDHPNIARVYDAGTTSAGRPYFVMELVRGIPITAYCDRERLSIRQRLELFVLVCRAVQHAHQKGIIHRDLKPSNILVTVIDGAAVPKVIDFGVAKAAGPALTERTIYTAFHQMIGTPLYMSPEQADLSGVDVDTRSDIYSLGVLLYELLTGTTPFDSETLRRATFEEMRRILREQEPPRPSTRLGTLGQTRATVSANRRAESRQLDRAVRGELDWIVMKALEKDRRRRYETASDFAADLVNYLTDRTVTASPPSAWYRLTKMARRNKGLISTSAVVLTILLAATGVSVRQAHRARQAEARAEADFRRARDVMDRVVLRVTDDLAHVPRSEPVRRALLEDALAFYQGFLAARRDRPEVRFEVARAALRVGFIREAIGDFGQAKGPAAQATALLEALVAADPSHAAYRLELAEAHTLLAQLLDVEHQKPAAIEHRRAALAQVEAVVARNPANPAYRRRMAGLRCNLGLGLSTEGTTEFAEAETHLRAALAIWERVRAEYPDTPANGIELARLHHWMGFLFQQTSRPAEAEREYRQALALLETARAAGPATPLVIERIAHTKSYLAELKREEGKPGEAEPILREVIALIEPLCRMFPEDEGYARRHGMACSRLSFCLWGAGRLAEAEALLSQELEIRQAVYEAHDGSARYAERLAACLCRTGFFLAESDRLAESLDAYHRAAGIYEKLLIQDPRNATAAMELAWWRTVGPAPLRDLPRAVRLAGRAVDFRPDDATAWRVLGIARYRSGDLPAARRALERALQLDPDERAAALFLAMTCARLGDPVQARAWYAKGVETPDPWFITDRLNRRFAAEAATLLGPGAAPKGAGPM